MVLDGSGHEDPRYRIECVMRRARLSIKRTDDREWSVFVVVEDGRWRIAIVGTVTEAIAIAAEVVRERQKQVLEVPA